VSKRSSKARRHEPVRHPIPPARLHAPQQRPAGNTTPTSDELKGGWSHTSDVQIRLARPEDLPHMRPLVALAGVELPSEVAGGVEKGIAAGALLAGLDGGRQEFTRHMATQFFEHQKNEQHVPFLHATLPLVAVHSTDGVVGTLVAYPPVGVVSQFLQQLPPGKRRLEAILCGGTGITRIKAVGVQSNIRHEGIGSALIRCCRQVYERCGFFIIYGQMPLTQGLDSFYRKSGFKVLDLGEGFDAWVVFGTSTLIHAPKDERIFVWNK
jgi:hypothetical protein